VRKAPSFRAVKDNRRAGVVYLLLLGGDKSSQKRDISWVAAAWLNHRPDRRLGRWPSSRKL